MPTTTLYIDGAPVDRVAANVDLGRMVVYNLDGPDEFTFVVSSTGYPGPYRLGQSVRVDIDGTPRFAGRIVHRSEPWNDGTGLVLTYRCFGLKWVARLVPVRHPTRGTGEVVYNLSPADFEYSENDAGLTLGEIIRRVLAVPDTANDLVANGVTAYTTAGPFSASNPPVLKAVTMADLAALTIVPNSPASLSGSKLWNQIVALVTEWMPVFSDLILADGTIRFLDTRTLTPLTLTLGTDPIERPDLDYDTSDTYTRVVVRGDDLVEGRWLDLKDGTLEADWTTGTTYGTNAAAEADWTWKKFSEPADGRSDGVITALSGTSVTIRPNVTNQTWAINKWSKDKAVLTVENVLLLGQATFSETRRVTACTARAAGGTSVLTVDYPFSNAGYNRYKLVGRGGAGSLTYRRLKIKDTYARSRIRRSFPLPYPMSSLAGQRDVRTPIAFLLRNISGTDAEPYTEWPGAFQFWTDPTDNELKVVFDEPYVKPFTSEADLTTGGAAVKKPHDVRIFVPISLGAMEAIRPASGFEGKAFTVDGIQRTLTIDMPSWQYKGDQAQLEAYAQIVLDSVKEPVVTGTVRHYGYNATAISTPGLSLNLAGATTTGKETLGAVVRSVVLTWPPSGAVNHTVDFVISTRRLAWSGDRLYVPQAFLGEDFFSGVGYVDGGMIDGGSMVGGVDQGDGGGGFGGGGFGGGVGSDMVAAGMLGMLGSARGFGNGNQGISAKEQVAIDRRDPMGNDAAQLAMLQNVAGKGISAQQQVASDRAIQGDMAGGGD